MNGFLDLDCDVAYIADDWSIWTNDKLPCGTGLVTNSCGLIAFGHVALGQNICKMNKQGPKCKYKTKKD